MITNNNIDLPENPRQVSFMLSNAYKDYRGVAGFIIKARPYICPFEEVLVRIKPTNTVLDVGCGSGSFSVLLAKCGLGKSVIGIDISENAINVAKKAQQVVDCPITFEIMKPGEYPQNLFDTVVCIDVVHHVGVLRQEEFVRSLCNKVEIGGQLLIKDISPLPRWKAAANTAHDIVMSNQWVNYRHEETVLKWLKENGMELIESCRLDRLWYGHYLISAQRVK